MHLRLRILPALAPALLAIGAGPSGVPVGFKDDVAPILVRHCLACHGGEKTDGGLDLSTFARLRKGGEMYAETILEPGDPDASALIELVRPDGVPRMPYKLDPLSPAEIEILERWVLEGARFDGPSESETPIASMVDPLRGLPDVEVTVPTSDPVGSAAFSPDGARLAASVGRDVLVFDLGSGRTVTTLADHPGPINALRFTPDGTTLIAAGGRPGQFGAVTAWDLANGSRRHDLRGHADSILGADLAPDGRTLATGGYDGLVKLWDLAQGVEARTLKEHTDAVYAVAFAPDGSTLATAGADRSVKLWDPTTGRNRRTLSEATAELYALAFSPDGKTLFSGGVDRSIRAYRIDDPGSATLVRSVVGHDGPILRLAVGPGGTTLYSSGEDRAVKAWDVATLAPRAAWPRQADWPLALAVDPDGRRVAIGRHDGSISVRGTGAEVPEIALRNAPGSTASPAPAPSPKPEAKAEVVRNASLGAPNPRGAVRGSTVKVTLTGMGVDEAREVLLPEPGLSATILRPEKPTPNRLEVELAIGPDARVGLHRIGVRTPLGIPAYQPFAVSAYPETTSTEPDDRPELAKAVGWPATLIGTIEKPGDLDAFRFEVEAGRRLVFESQARALGSILNARLSLLDEAGRVVAEARGFDDRPDPILAFEADRSGSFTLQVADVDYGGSGNHHYRIQAGPLPSLEAAFPLGVEPGGSVEVGLVGMNLESETLTIKASVDATPGETLEITARSPEGLRPGRGLRLVVAEGRQASEDERGDSSDVSLSVPGGISGRIDREGDSDSFRFEARKGERLVLEVFGRRLGSPIDPAIEILDLEGRPVPRALLRPLAETAVAFRDHDSTRRGIRLTRWDDFAVGDTLLFGREVSRMAALPRNPDDDASFWGLGDERKAGSTRLGLLETTPEQHPQGQPVYKVEIHPPGATLPPGGLPTVTLNYRNDDGGPAFGKDSRLTFDPPADGTYLVRVEDVRGLGGPQFGYHLVVRRPRPRFELTLGVDDLDVPRGGSAIVTARVARLDGFEGPVEVTLEGLPPGIRATSTTIGREAFEADLLVSADASAPDDSPPVWRAIGRARPEASGESAGEELRVEVDPGGPGGGRITVTPPPDLRIVAEPGRLAIRPGDRAQLTFRVERGAGLTGRVPIEVLNLPRGVRVLDIGLNGILVTESKTERLVTFYAEPWAEPTERPLYATGRLEVLGKPKAAGLGAPVVARSRDLPMGPIDLVVLPPAEGPRASTPAPNAKPAADSAGPR